MSPKTVDASRGFEPFSAQSAASGVTYLLGSLTMARPAAHVHAPAPVLPLLLILAAARASSSPAASVRFSNVFGDDMVLQADKPAPVWGWAAPSASVRVSLSSGAFNATVQADAAGFFRAVLPSAPASMAAVDVLAAAPDGSSAALRRVLFGTVILCSGQSNMEFTVASLANASAEIAAAPAYTDRVRLYSAAYVNTSFAPTSPRQEMLNVSLPWAAASVLSVGGGPWLYFSALCWLAARGVADRFPATPVGAVHASIGGTPIQYWMSPEALSACPAVPGMACCGMGGTSSCLWDAFIFPLTLGPAQYSAVLWMQGEQNAMPGVEQADYYDCALPAMIASWRAAFEMPALPFGVFALAPYRSSEPTDDGFPRVRLIQAALAARDPAVFFVSTLDGGDPVAFAIHSPFKEAAGARAALGLRAVALRDATARLLGPRATAALSGAGAQPGTILSVVVFNDTSLYGAAPLLNTSVACPAGLPIAYCESFAVMTSDGMWRSVEDPGAPGVTLTPHAYPSAPTSMALVLAGAPDGLKVLAVRGGYRVWPLVQLRNEAGIPAEPFILNCSQVGRLSFPGLW